MTWKLVPEEPTKEMLDAGFECGKSAPAYLVYTTMLAAAPQPSSEPVAWMVETTNGNLHTLDPNREANWLAFDLAEFKHNKANALAVVKETPLFIHPPKPDTEELEALRAELRRINNVASCGTTDSWMSLSDDDKRKWFAQSIHTDAEKAKIIKEQDYQLTRYRAVMEQAAEFIDTLEFADDDTECNNVITALREALKEE